MFEKQTGKMIKTFLGHETSIYKTAMSHSSNVIASGDFTGIIKIWSPDGSNLCTLEGHDQPISALEFNENDTHLISASLDGKIIIWDVKTGAKLKEYVNADHAVSAIQISKDADEQKIVAAQHDGTTLLYSNTKGEETAKYLGHSAPVRDIAADFDADVLYTLSEDHKIKTWKLGTGECIATREFVDKLDLPIKLILKDAEDC